MNILVDWGRRNWRTALFLVLSLAANLCACYYFNVGVKYGVACLMMAWAVAEFAVKPDFAKARQMLRFFLLFYFPFLMFWSWSLVLWIMQLQDRDYIVRGSLNTIYMFTIIGYFLSAYYLFGGRSIYLNFYTMCAANTVKLLQVCLAYSPGQVFSEYFALLRTFTGETGDAIHAMELHDMVFGFGPYIVFFLLYRKKGRLQLGHLLLACFFFTLALKRIAVPGVILGALVGGIYLRLPDRFKTLFARLVGYTAIVGVFLYIWGIRSGVYFQLADALHIDLMSRDFLFTYYEDLYDFSPTYLGQGIRFIYEYGQNTTTQVGAVHCVFLEFLIETGFWCWTIWLFYEMRFRIHRVAKRFGLRSAAFLLAATVYMWTTFMTDNTSFYWPPNVAYMHLTVFWIDLSVRQAQCGTASAAPPRRRGLLARVTF